MRALVILPLLLLQLKDTIAQDDCSNGTYTFSKYEDDCDSILCSWPFLMYGTSDDLSSIVDSKSLRFIVAPPQLESNSTLRETFQLMSPSKACYDQFCSSDISSISECVSCTNIFSGSPADCCTADDPAGCFAYLQESLDCATDLVSAESSVIAENGYELATSTDYGSVDGGLATPTPTAGVISSVDATELGGVATNVPYFSNLAVESSPTETAGPRQTSPSQQGGSAMPNGNGGQPPPP